MPDSLDEIAKGRRGRRLTKGLLDRAEAVAIATAEIIVPHVMLNLTSEQVIFEWRFVPGPLPYGAWARWYCTDDAWGTMRIVEGQGKHRDVDVWSVEDICAVLRQHLDWMENLGRKPINLPPVSPERPKRQRTRRMR